MFPDLNVITFDGNSVAVFKAALYVVTQLPNETISILVQECPGPDDTVRYLPSEQDSIQYKTLFCLHNIYMLASHEINLFDLFFAISLIFH